MVNEANSKVGLSRSQWTILIILTIVAIFTVWGLAHLLSWSIEKFEQVSLTIGALALAVSAYAAMSTKRLKQFEIEKGFLAAKSLINVDAQEALSESHNTYDKLSSYQEKSIEKWNSNVIRLKALEERYERRQDQLPFLAAHLPPDKCLGIQQFYLELQRHFDIVEELIIQESIRDVDIDAAIDTRKRLCQRLIDGEKRILRCYQNLNFEKVPGKLQERVTSASSAVPIATEN